jgi:hypothetical protein
MEAYQLKVTLYRSDPSIWRRILIPVHLYYHFQELRQILLVAMGWEDDHLTLFELSQEELQIPGAPPHAGHQTLRQSNDLADNRTFINELLHEKQKFTFVYDFGDDWQHHVIVEKIVTDYENEYPQVIAYEGNCPPEDVGGIAAYTMLLQALENPDDPVNEEMVEWIAEWMENEEINEYDLEMVNNRLSRMTVDKQVRRKRKTMAELKIAKRNRKKSPVSGSKNNSH